MTHSVDKTPALLRLETFTDAVIAVAITIMVLDLKPPEVTLHARQTPLDFSFLHHYWPKVLALALSFLIIATRWVGLVTYFRQVTRASSALIWRTLANLFAICLVPWAAAFLAEHPTLPQAVAAYGFVGLCLLATTAALERNVERDYPTAVQDYWSYRRTVVIAGVWALSIPLAFLSIYFSFMIFAAMSLLYLFPRELQGRVFRPLFDRRPVRSRDDDA